MPTDEELLARLSRGDDGAFDIIYERYRPRIFRFLLRMSRRRDVAEDLLQETWLRFARKSRSIEDGTRLGPWLFAVARNLVTSRQRWALLDLARLDALRLLPPTWGSDPSPLELASASELERTLERAIGALPPRYREVILLVGGEDLDPKDVASILGIRPEALRQRLSRARGMLREALEAHMEIGRAVKEPT